MLGVAGERRVARHEEVQVGRRDQRRDQPDQVVVHVRGVPVGKELYVLLLKYSSFYMVAMAP